MADYFVAVNGRCTKTLLVEDASSETDAKRRVAADGGQDNAEHGISVTDFQVHQDAWAWSTMEAVDVDLDEAIRGEG